MKIFVPGRTCLFGEHSDRAGGYRRINADIERGCTLICGTDQGIHAETAPHPTSLVLTTTTPDGERLGPYEIPMEPRALLEEAGKGSFWSDAAGVAYQDEITTPSRCGRLPEKEYLTLFGQYIIKPQIFDYPEKHIKHNVREHGEFQLTSALDRLRQEDGFHGLIVDGKRYDIGLPEHYLETLRTFSQE
jgi:hypothetical protein